MSPLTAPALESSAASPVLPESRPRLTPVPSPALPPEERLARDVDAALRAAGCTVIHSELTRGGNQLALSIRFTPDERAGGALPDLHDLDRVARRHRAAVAQAGAAGLVGSATLLLALP
jgi:hypothetical protein